MDDVEGYSVDEEILKEFVDAIRLNITEGLREMARLNESRTTEEVAELVLHNALCVIDGVSPSYPDGMDLCVPGDGQALNRSIMLHDLIK